MAKIGAKQAMLVLEDGTAFAGTSCGAPGEVFGEICFNTSLEGYLEVISDPSYAGQIVVMTYPQVGNYGVCLEDCQGAGPAGVRRSPALRGLVVRDMCAEPSNWRCDLGLPEYCLREGITAIEGLDTRALVRHIRDFGAQRAVISTRDLDAASLLAKVRQSPSIVGVNLASGVSCTAPYAFGAADLPQSHAFAKPEARKPRFRVTVYDCGVKRSILENLVRAGCALDVVPWDTPAEEVLAGKPDGVFLSNGPGDPEAVTATYMQVERLLGRVPVFGICLGHQMMSLAAGARMEKLPFGHHGGNQPVMNLMTHRVEVTAQNHGFNLDFASLGALCPGLSGGVEEHPADLRFWIGRRVAPVVENARFGRVALTHVNVNDGTAEGMAFLDIPAFSVQYHPEASPGPTDAHYLFTAFVRLMEAHASGRAADTLSCLDIDIATSRLSGWRFGRMADDEDSSQGKLSCERFRTSENGTIWQDNDSATAVFASSGPSERGNFPCGVVGAGETHA